MKEHHDHDDDSGMGPSTFTDTKSTTFSEVNTLLPSLINIVWLLIVLSAPSSALGSLGQGAERIRL